MATDPKECREQAKRCLKLAAETNDPVLGHASKSTRAVTLASAGAVRKASKYAAR